MFSLAQVEADLTSALKARNSIVVDTLRGLKTRIQNEHISKMRALEEADLFSLVRSEIKRRKEAADGFTAAGRAELADKELAELAVLEAYLPDGPTEEELRVSVTKIIAEHGFTAKDFGLAMKQAKQHFPHTDGQKLATLIKEKLEN